MSISDWPGIWKDYSIEKFIYNINNNGNTNNDGNTNINNDGNNDGNKIL